jgi:hypothetical protein
MAKNDPAVGFDEVFAVIVDFAGSGAPIVEGEDLRGDPLRVETITDGIGAKRCDEDVSGTDAFAAMERKRDVGKGAEASDGEPNKF